MRSDFMITVQMSDLVHEGMSEFFSWATGVDDNLIERACYEDINTMLDLNKIFRLALERRMEIDHTLTALSTFALTMMSLGSLFMLKSAPAFSLAVSGTSLAAIATILAKFGNPIRFSDMLPYKWVIGKDNLELVKAHLAKEYKKDQTLFIDIR